MSVRPFPTLLLRVEAGRPGVGIFTLADSEADEARLDWWIQSSKERSALLAAAFDTDEDGGQPIAGAPAALVELPFEGPAELCIVARTSEGRERLSDWIEARDELAEILAAALNLDGGDT